MKIRMPRLAPTVAFVLSALAGLTVDYLIAAAPGRTVRLGDRKREVLAPVQIESSLDAKQERGENALPSQPTSEQ